jgi:hypothetical protein
MESNKIMFLSLIIFLSACTSQNGSPGQEMTDDYMNIKTLQTSYSPDKRCHFTIKEHGTDSLYSYTQLLLNFKTTGSGVYSVRGINKDLKARWKDNSTIIIETRKEYISDQKWPQVQSFSDIVTIEYIEK